MPRKPGLPLLPIPKELIFLAGHADDRGRSFARSIGLGKGLTNRQISQEMFLAEKTVKNMVSSVLTKLGMTSRSQAAVFIARALNHQENPADGDHRNSPFPDLIADVTAALLNCTSETRTAAPTDAERAEAARRLADTRRHLAPHRQ